MAGWFYITSDIDPYPKIHIPHTYPEKGHHLHHVPLPYLAHDLYTKFHDKDLDAHQPKTDVRETVKNFYLEVELPGIKEQKDLRLRWTNSRTLLLTSKTSRPDIPEDELLEEPALPATTPAPEATQHNGEATTTPPTTEPPPQSSEHETVPQPPSTAPQNPKLLPAHLTIHERAIGEMVRAYNFPVDVSLDDTTAKLDAGILRIVVPKVIREAAPASEGGAEKHFLHVPIRILGHGHEHEREHGQKPENKPEHEGPAPPARAIQPEALGNRLY